MTTQGPIRTGQLELVDEHGVVRMTLTAGESDVVIDGAQKERVASFAGIIVRDEIGNERGGLGYLGGPDGRAVWALDNPAFDAIGAMVGDDGAVTFAVNQPPAPTAGEDGSVEGATRLLMRVAADGTPSISLADAQDRPRLRLSLKDDGAGAIEFLDATGAVVHSIVPEHE
ncbi:hypothetical protein BH09ACT12_BH09ACT12_29050 [soil metagenome]